MKWGDGVGIGVKLWEKVEMKGRQGGEMGREGRGGKMGMRCSLQKGRGWGKNRGGRWGGGLLEGGRFPRNPITCR